ncbi:MAG TPA: type II toxin-antitoxin system VapC family toxin [Terracidiphilus sp.]
MNIYADSSFIAPLYVMDTHVAEARRRLASKPQIWLTPMNRAEVAHALHQQVFRKRITDREARLGWSLFEEDCAAGVWIQIDLPERAWETSIDLARRYGPSLGVRTLDSLHVACALELKALRFWSFDERQARLAEAVGLDTKG